MPNLAVRGGTPVRTKPWPDWPQHDDRELRNLTRVVESGNWGGFPSPNVMAGEFAERFAEYHGAKWGVCTTGGTTALEVSLRAAGLERGDEVIVPDQPARDAWSLKQADRAAYDAVMRKQAAKLEAMS